MILGERILDRGERSSYRFKELRESMDLPRVGERIRSKEFDTVWKVIEEKETWIEAPGDTSQEKNSSRLMPTISLRYWKEDTSSAPGTGQTKSFRYSRIDPRFDRYWEVLYDW